MKATITVDVNIDHARTALMIAGYRNVYNMSDKEVCEMAIKKKLKDMNKKENNIMKDRILDFLTGLVVVFSTLAIIVLIMMAAVHADANRDRNRWNNGYHQCGGKWVYEQAVGHRYSTNYIYKCDKCGMREEFLEYRNN